MISTYTKAISDVFSTDLTTAHLIPHATGPGKGTRPYRRLFCVHSVAQVCGTKFAEELLCYITSHDNTTATRNRLGTRRHPKS